jgi:hypothetical protein
MGLSGRSSKLFLKLKKLFTYEPGKALASMSVAS